MERQRENGEGELEQDEELRALARLLGGKPRSAPPPPTTTTPTTTPMEHAAPAAERFELLQRIGSGPNGEVFLARDREQLGRELCVKLLWPGPSARPGLAERLEELSHQLRSLEPTGFVRPLALARDPAGRLLIASERTAGESLAELCARRGALAPRHALEITRQILVLLEHAHRRGLPHGHLCAENVRLASRVPWSAENPFGVGVRLEDHGLAALLGHEASEARDLFDLARLLAELLAGTRLGPDTDGANGPGDWAAARAAVPRDVRVLLDRALDPRPERRFPDATAWRRALERGRSWRRDPSRWPSLGAGALGLAALSFAALGLFAFAYLRGARSARAAELARREDEVRDGRERRELALACSALDRFLESLEEGNDDGARAVLAEARAAPELASLGFATGFLEAGLETARLLSRADGEAAALERAQVLQEARGSVRAARATREAFRLRAAAWLALDLPPRPARGEDCLRWFDGLQREVEQRSSALEPALEERWDALSRSGSGLAEGDAHAALTLAAWFADERVSAWAAHLAARGSSADEALAERLLLLVSPVAFPGAVGTTRLYRERLPSGGERWVLTTVLSADEAACWQLEERALALDGSDETRRELTLERLGTCYRERGAQWGTWRTWFDLAEDTDPPGTFDPSPGTPVPDALGVGRAALERFRTELAGTRALALRGERGTAWISAHRGLLRTRATDGAERELLYASDD